MIFPFSSVGVWLARRAELTPNRVALGFCAERLARFKVPASVVFTDSLPRNPTRKLIKAELRERYGDER